MFRFDDKKHINFENKTAQTCLYLWTVIIYSMIFCWLLYLWIISEPGLSGFFLYTAIWGIGQYIVKEAGSWAFYYIWEFLS